MIPILTQGNRPSRESKENLKILNGVFKEWNILSRQGNLTGNNPLSSFLLTTMAAQIMIAALVVSMIIKSPEDLTRP